ncbi:MAG: zf-TFIIB domain-containing protein [Hyphomonas sp.]|jgi:Zn-finger nucleic acid-binding protein
MKCPADGETLVMTERSGVEIDYCPKCRGIWLDRGELDKIIDRAATVLPAPAPEPVQRPEHFRDEGRFHDRHDDDDDWKYGKRKRHKRESFLSDLFDF